MATDTYLQFTNGSITLTFFDGSGGATNFRIRGGAWAPGVGGIDDEVPVLETFEAVVKGSTAADCMANVQSLVRFFHDAEKWAGGDPSYGAPLIKYSPKGGTVSTAANPLQTAVLGAPPGQRAVQLPANWELQAGANKLVTGIRVQFLRRPRWLANTETSASSSATDNCNLATISLGSSHTIESPTRLRLTNPGIGYLSGAYYFYGGYIAVSDDSTGIWIGNAESLASGAWTSVAAGGENARNTNILRYTPAGTTEVVTASVPSGLTASCTLVAVYANVRNNSTTVGYRLRAFLQKYVTVSTPWVDVPAQATAYPYWLCLGVVALPQDVPAAPTVWLSAIATSAAGSIDIDSVVLVDLSKPTTRVITLPRWDDAVAGYTSTYEVNHRLLTDLRPAFETTGAIVFQAPAYGDLIIDTKGTSVYALLMATGQSTTSPGNKWRQSDAASAVIQNTWTAYRRSAYLSPE